MATVKIFGKENGVAILLPSGKFIYGDPDGDFVAENGTASDEVSIKRSVNDFFVVRDLVHTSVKDKDGNAIAANRDAVVTALNSNFFNRGSSLFEIGDVEDPGSGSLSKTDPDRKLQLKVKSDGSGFELVNKPSVVENIGGSASEFGSGDNQVLAWTLSKQLEGGSDTNLYRAAIRPSVNVQADVSYEDYNGDSYRTTALTVRDITASITLKDNGVINSESKNIILNPADTYVTSITRLKTSGDTIIGGDIKTASGTNDDIVIECDGTGRVRFKSEIMPHADQDLVIHSGGTGNMIVKPDLQVDGEIVTGSNDDLVLNPGGTGAIVFQADDIRFEQTSAITGGEIRLNEFNSLGSNYVALRAPLSLSADVAFTLPAADGTNGQVLKTNGSGTLSFVDSLSDTTATLKGTTSLKPVGGLDASLAFYDDAGDNFVVLRAPDTLTSDTTFRLPDSDGSSGQVIKTDGSGNLSFVDQTADTNTSLANTDQTLTGTRTINVNQSDLFIKDGSNIKLQFDSSADEFLFTSPVRFDGGNAGGFIKLRETVMGGTDGVILRAPSGAMSGDVEFRLPNADGSSGQFIKTDGSGNLSFGDAGGGSSSTFKQVYHQNFIDDIGTTKHYLPFKDINEQTTIYQEEAAIIMPYDGRVVSVSIRLSTITGAGAFTVGVNTRPTGVSQFTASNWTEEETETMTFTATDDYHTFHFVFDNAQHFEAGDLCSISLQSSGDPGGFSYWYVSTIVEYDTTTDLGSSSTEHGQNP
jgi:hypothetical protein